MVRSRSIRIRTTDLDLSECKGLIAKPLRARPDQPLPLDTQPYKYTDELSISYFREVGWK